ncbi:MAG: hypothetical protein HRT72_00155 [Flavobacteriales bacterium]|nr:hypothetical protein [Flavobacteriales bacterium]
MHVQINPRTAKKTQELLLENGIIPTITGKADIYFSAASKSITPLKDAISRKDCKYYMQIPGILFIAKKEWLWMSMLEKFGRRHTLEILPETYVLRLESDRKALLELSTSNPDEVFIAKGRMQKRKSIELITAKDIGQVINRDRHLVVQRIIKCTSILDEQIFHIRFYTLFTVKNNVLTGHILEQGKLVYSSNSKEIITDNNIVPGINLPKTTEDLFRSEPSLDQTEFWRAVSSFISDLTKSIQHRIINDKLNPNTPFAQLLGVDIILNELNQPRLLEVNIRPEMYSNVEADNNWKKAVFKDWVTYFLLEEYEASLPWIKAIEIKLSHETL